jgi:very-short-patch-repair endonuclease
LKFPKKEIICESLWTKDAKKKEIALKKGYNVVYLWESFIRNSSDDEIIDELKKILDRIKQSDGQ